MYLHFWGFASHSAARRRCAFRRKSSDIDVLSGWFYGGRIISEVYSALGQVVPLVTVIPVWCLLDMRQEKVTAYFAGITGLYSGVLASLGWDRQLARARRYRPRIQQNWPGRKCIGPVPRKPLHWGGSSGSWWGVLISQTDRQFAPIAHIPNGANVSLRATESRCCRQNMYQRWVLHADAHFSMLSPSNFLRGWLLM